MCMEISLLLISMHKLPHADTRLSSYEGLLHLVQHFSSDPQTCTVATIIHNVVLYGLLPHSQAPLPSFYRSV